VIAGQGTIALEMCEEPNFSGTEAVILPISGGGLMSGCASVLRALRPEIKIYGVTAKNAPGTWRSFHENKVLTEEVKYTLAEGVANKGTDATMMAYLKSLVDDVFSISEEAIALAISALAEHGKMILEGAGALPVAALLEGLIPEKRVTAVLSGGNIDLTALSTVIHRGLVEQGRVARLAITIPDRPGGLHSITEILSQKRANILQVFHQRASLNAGIGEAEVEVDIETRGIEHTLEIMDTLSSRGFQVQRVS